MLQKDTKSHVAEKITAMTIMTDMWVAILLLSIRVEHGSGLDQD